MSVRTVERIVSRAARKAGLTQSVCCTTLRRSYAVQCLREGMDVCRLRESLGHQHLETTLQYERYLSPPNHNPLDCASCLTPKRPHSRTPTFLPSLPPALAALHPSGP